MKKLLTLLFVFMAHFCVGQQAGTIEKTTCFMNDCSLAEKNSNLQFGYLYVPENYEDSTSPLRKMAFVIIKNTSPERKPDPIMIFQGGWGMPIIEDDLGFYMRSYLSKDRDLILFDYRGCGLSEPTLCAWAPDSIVNIVKAKLDFEETNKRQKRVWDACLDSIQAKGINFNCYGTNNKGRDAVLLAEKLGYPEYNLFGISNGTRNILSFIRYANVKVRCAILDSNVPVGFAMNGNLINNYVNVLDNIFTDCENNPACNIKFPDLRNRFQMFLQSLDQDNLQVKLGNGEMVYLNKEEVNTVLHQFLYWRSQYKNLPLFINNMISRDPFPWQEIAPLMLNSLRGESSGLGLINAVYDYKPLQQKEKANYEASMLAHKDYNLYQPYMDYLAKDTRFGQDSLDAVPVESDSRVLILAGTYDPITPPEASKFLFKGLPNHYYFEFPRVGHGISFQRCGYDIVRQFLENPSRRPDDSCLQKMGQNEIPFTTSFYQNSRISKIVTRYFATTNWWVYAGIAFIVLICLVNLSRSVVVSFTKKTKTKRPLLTVTSLLTLVFLGGLAWWIFQTFKRESFLMLFGLLKNANYIFFLVPILFVLTVILSVQVFRKKDFKLLPLLTLLAMIILFAVVGYYQMFPNLS